MPRNQAEIERDVFNAYKIVRNHFRKFEPLSIVFGLLKFLNSPSTAVSASHQPWLILLLIKWIFQDEQIWHQGRPKIDDRNLRKLINSVYKAEEKGRSPQETQSLEMFFRRMMYQQFGYQNQIDGVLSSFTLDVKLFGKDINPGFSQEFKQRFQLTVEEYLVLAFAIVSSLLANENQHDFQVNFFDEIADKFEENTSFHFLEAISITLIDIPERLARPIEKGVNSDEFHETSPFLNFPFVKTNDRYFVTHRDLVIRALKHFLYGSLKAMNSDKRNRKFSELFEESVGNHLRSLSTNTISEGQLKQKIGDQGKVVDFVVEEIDALVLVEAKATELAETGRLATNTQRLKDRMKSVLTAVKQAEQTLERMELNGLFDQNSLKSYLVIVTYGQFYIGDGTLLGALFEGTSFSAPEAIPIENIFILSFAEFEYLIAVAKECKKPINGILEQVKEVASKPEDRKVMFQNYLDDLFPGLELPRDNNDPFTLLLENSLPSLNFHKDE